MKLNDDLGIFCEEWEFEEDREDLDRKIESPEEYSPEMNLTRIFGE